MPFLCLFSSDMTFITLSGKLFLKIKVEVLRSDTQRVSIFTKHTQSACKTFQIMAVSVFSHNIFLLS